MQRSLADPPATRRTVSDAGLLLLTFEQFEEGEPAAVCPITHMPFGVGDAITSLPCKHRFSPAAIKRWLTEENHVCPVCRYALPFKEERYLPGLRPRRPRAERRAGVNPSWSSTRVTQPTMTMIIRTRTLTRAIEDAVTELRSLGYEPSIVPNYTTSHARVTIRNRVSVPDTPVPSSTVLGSWTDRGREPADAPAVTNLLRRAATGAIVEPPSQAEHLRHTELWNEIMALAMEAMVT